MRQTAVRTRPTLWAWAWAWACRVLPDAAVQGLCREDFDEETFGATRVERPVERDDVERRVLSPTPAAQPSV